MAKGCFLRPKRVKNVVFGPEKFFSQISQKMAKIWPKDNFKAQKDWKCGFWPRKIFQPNRSKNGRKMPEIWPKDVFMPKRLKSGIGPKKKIRPNWWKNGRNMATHTQTCKNFPFIFFPYIQLFIHPQYHIYRVQQQLAYIIYV